MNIRFLRFVAIAVATGAALTASVALATRPPLAGPGHATIALDRTQAWTSSNCVGGDADYYTLSGASWSGTIDDNNNFMIPYHLHGDMTLAGSIVMNTNVGMGVFGGSMRIMGTHENPTDTDPLIDARGPIRVPLIQYEGSPDLQARGMIDLPLYSNNAKNGSELIANVEFSVSTVTGQVTGIVGWAADSTIPPLGIEFNGESCAGKV